MAIIITKNQMINLFLTGLFMGLIVGLGTFIILNKNNDLADLRERASKGLVYVDSQSLVYKCEVK